MRLLARVIADRLACLQRHGIVGDQGSCECSHSHNIVSIRPCVKGGILAAGQQVYHTRFITPMAGEAERLSVSV